MLNDEEDVDGLVEVERVDSVGEVMAGDVNSTFCGFTSAHTMYEAL